MMPIALVVPVTATASTFSWKVDGSGNWNDAANWNLVEGAPGLGYPNAPGDRAELPGALTTANRTITIPDGVTVTIGSLAIDDDHVYTVAAAGTGSLVLATAAPSVSPRISIGTIVGNGAHAIAAPVLLQGNLTIASSGQLTFTGGIGEDSTARTVSIEGGLVRFASSVNNTYTGETTVVAGTLELAHLGGTTAIAGDLSIGVGAGADVVRLFTDENIAPGSSVRTNTQSGQLDLNDRTESFSELDLDNNGSVTIRDGVLTVASVRMNGSQISATANGRLVLSATGQGVTAFSSTNVGATILGGTLDLGAGGRTFDVDASPAAFDLTVLSTIVGTSGLTKTGGGVMQVGRPNMYTGTTIVDAGTLLVNGPQPASPVSVVGGTLGGTGTVGAITATGGAVAPGVTQGTLTSGDATLGSATTFAVELNGDAPGAFDQLEVVGAVTLTNTILAATRTFSPAPGTTFTIIDNAGSGAVSGTFAGLPQGAVLMMGDRSFTISYTGGDGNDVVLTAEQPPLTYSFAEGATGTFFDTDLLIANPQNVDLPATLTFFKEDHTTVVVPRTIPAQSRVTVHVDEIEGLEATTAAMEVRSDVGVPLVVERTMFWNASSYGGHTGTALAPSNIWHFAEGAQGFFDTYLLVENRSDHQVDVTFTFLREREAPFEVTRPVAETSRFTFQAGAYPELRDRLFGAVVTAATPIVVERAMYFGSTATQHWTGGHASGGVSVPSSEWFLAEGATGSFFDTFILMSNPQDAPANVTLTYLLDGGQTVESIKTIPAKERLTVSIEAESDPRLHAAAVSTVVTSSVPIVAERSMYWQAGEAVPWGEAHHGVGLTQAGTRWGLAEGRVGGPLNFTTFILLANPDAQAAEIAISYLRESGTPIVKTYTVPATSRVTLDVRSVVPELQDESFGALVTVTSGPPILVERAMYWDSNGVMWAGGTNAGAARLPD